MTKHAGYVIINETAIWGVGETEAEAWEYSREWIEGDPDRQEFTAEQASAALVSYVHKHGTPNSWGILHGIQCTNAEEADEEFYVAD